MSMDWGYTVEPSEGGGEIMEALAEADAPRHSEKTPSQWLKSNLFNNWYNSIITVVFGTVALWAGYKALSFVFVTARWEPVADNIELFMLGLFPRAEVPRVIVQLFLISGAGGLIIGWLKARAQATADEAGIEVQKTPIREYASSYSALAVFILATLIVGADTIGPWLVLLGCIIAAAVGFLATRPLTNPLTKIVLFAPLLLAAGMLKSIQDLNNQAAYLIAGIAVLLLFVVNLTQSISMMLSAGLLAGVSGFQALSGTGGIAWVFTLLAILPVGLHVIGIATERLPAVAAWGGVAIIAAALVWRAAIEPFGVVTIVLAIILIAAVVPLLRGDGGLALRAGGVILLGLLSWAACAAADVSGIDWSNWGGLQLNIVVAGASTVLAFPIGLLLALGRRSSLPVVRYMCTAYIEIIRGVPLISLLLMGAFFIGFFINSDTPLSAVTRATAAITMFSAAYIAEIVRGGLQAVDRGQTEAGQALGLPAAKITRLLILPQALRAVIPAMVGQFISLFKDTSLLSIIAILEFLGVREIVHAQEDFRGFGIAETLVYVAFGFWAISFTMSRESQRLERNLDVGDR
jgi:general L-amino acid transport system permease protein